MAAACPPARLCARSEALQLEGARPPSSIERPDARTAPKRILAGTYTILSTTLNPNTSTVRTSERPP
jgi:hypothetical protein